MKINYEDHYLMSKMILVIYIASRKAQGKLKGLCRKKAGLGRTAFLRHSGIRFNIRL